MPKTIDEKNPWLTIRSMGIKKRLTRWHKKFRGGRLNLSDAARLILEQRLEADGVK